MVTRLTEEELELEFLRYFYDTVGESLGPADSEVYCMIKQQFMDDTELPLPEGYEIE